MKYYRTMSTFIVTTAKNDLDASVLHFASKNNIKIYDQSSNLRGIKSLQDKEAIRSLRRKMYYSKPEVQEKRKKYYESEEVKKKRKEYNQKEETKARKKALNDRKRELLKKFRELHPDIYESIESKDEVIPDITIATTVNRNNSSDNKVNG